MQHYQSGSCSRVVFVGWEELDHAAKDSWRRCNCFICRLNDRRAPGLEQKHDYRSCDWPCIYSCIRRRRGLGCANSLRVRTPTSLCRKTQITKRDTLKNAFAGHEERPTESELSSALGDADALWRGLVADLKRDLKLDSEEWNSYSIKAGWSLRLQRKKRNIVYLSLAQVVFWHLLRLGIRQWQPPESPCCRRALANLSKKPSVIQRERQFALKSTTPRMQRT
jgi:hypothetical protein